MALTEEQKHKKMLARLRALDKTVKALEDQQRSLRYHAQIGRALMVLIDAQAMRNVYRQAERENSLEPPPIFGTIYGEEGGE